MRIAPLLVTMLLLCACSRTGVTADTSPVLSPSASGTATATATAEQTARSLKVLDRAVKKSKPGCSAVAVAVADAVPDAPVDSMVEVLAVTPVRLQAHSSSIIVTVTLTTGGIIRMRRL